MHFSALHKPEVRCLCQSPSITQPLSTQRPTQKAESETTTKIDGPSQSWAEPFSHLAYPASARNPRQPVFYQIFYRPCPIHPMAITMLVLGRVKEFLIVQANSGPLPELNWLCPL
jgi:hypothetical protein